MNNEPTIIEIDDLIGQTIAAVTVRKHSQYDDQYIDVKFVNKEGVTIVPRYSTGYEKPIDEFRRYVSFRPYGFEEKPYGEE